MNPSHRGSLEWHIEHLAETTSNTSSGRPTALPNSILRMSSSFFTRSKFGDLKAERPIMIKKIKNGIAKYGSFETLKKIIFYPYNFYLYKKKRNFLNLKNAKDRFTEILFKSPDEIERQPTKTLVNQNDTMKINDHPRNS